MNNPSIIGIERLGLHGPAAVAHGIGKVLHFLHERIIANVSMVLDIDDRARARRLLCEKQAIQQLLDVVERLVVTADQQRGVSRIDLQYRMAVALLLLNFEREAEVSQNGIENFLRRFVHDDDRFFPVPPGPGRFGDLILSSFGSGLFRVW